MDDHEVELQSRKKLMEHAAWKVFVFGIFGDFWQYLSLFSPNAGKCGPGKLGIWAQSKEIKQN